MNEADLEALGLESLVTDDGSITLIHPSFKEAYSSKFGALMQARELYLKLTQTQHPSPRVLEIGFGLGVNFRTTLQDGLGRGVRLEYQSYELFPVEVGVLGSVEVPLSAQAGQVWQALLSGWPQAIEKKTLGLEGDWGSLAVHFADITQVDLPEDWATAVYLDPFSPEVNPEPWSKEVLAKLYSASQPGAYLATYSVAGQFRRDLSAVGFEVHKVRGVGKKQWTQGHKAWGIGRRV